MIKLPKSIKRGMSFKDATFMGIMRWSLYEQLKTMYQNVHLTYGYITKNIRIENNLPKDHYIDARCISGNANVEPLGYVFYQRKLRCHNRQIHKQKFSKGGIRKRKQAPYELFGFRLFDKVRVNNTTGLIFGRRQRGCFDIRDFDNKRICEVSYKKLKLLEKRKSYIVERRMGVSSHD